MCLSMVDRRSLTCAGCRNRSPFAGNLSRNLCCDMPRPPARHGACEPINWTVPIVLSRVAAQRQRSGERPSNKHPGFLMLLRQLADRICQVKFGDLPSEAVAMAKLAIL